MTGTDEEFVFVIAKKQKKIFSAHSFEAVGKIDDKDKTSETNNL